MIVREIIMNTKVTKVNIWEVIMTFTKKGDIQMINSKFKEESILDKASKKKIKQGLYTHKGYMLNYFSMGDCAKIGYEFERNRTTSRCGNIIQYFCAGLKRICCSCCWTYQENRRLRDQIKYAKAGSRIDELIERENKL